MPCQPDPPVSQVSGTGRLLEPHRFPNEYAVGNKIESPSHLYVREDLVLDPLDTWLAEAFAPHRIGQSLTALENAQPDHTPAVEAARRAIAECKRKLARQQPWKQAPIPHRWWHGAKRCNSNARPRRHDWPTLPLATV